MSSPGYGYSFRPSASIATNLAMRLARVSGFFASWSRYRIAYRLRPSSVAKNLTAARFFRSADPRVQRERGSGLGLAVTHALVKRIGGTITVDSKPDHGTTFRLTLPSARSA